MVNVNASALRGIAAEFLFRRLLPLSWEPVVWAPRVLPPRLRLAFSCMRRSPPSGKGRAPLPGAAAPPPGRARCGMGPCRAGRGLAGEDPVRLRHQLHCAGTGVGGAAAAARGRTPRCSYCALTSPSPLHLPVKRSSGEAHRCLHYIISPPLSPRPPRTP